MLPLAWLVRTNDTALHRQWLQTAVDGLLTRQHCEEGEAWCALKEELSHPGWGGGTYLHWDASVAPGSAPPLHGGLQIQGVLYLADTPVNGGGIRVVAGFHRMLEADLGLYPIVTSQYS